MRDSRRRSLCALGNSSLRWAIRSDSSQQCLPAWSVHWGARFAVAMADSSKVWFSTRLRSIPATRVVRWWTHVDGLSASIRRSLRWRKGSASPFPAGTAQWVLTEILTQGRVRRAYLGVTVRDRTLDLRLVRALDLQVTRAVEIMTRDDQGRRRPLI